MELQQNILKMVEQALPAMQMETLKKELDKAALHEGLLQRLDVKENDISKLRIEIVSLKEKLKAQDEIDDIKKHIQFEKEQIRIAKSDLSKDTALYQLLETKNSLQTVIELTRTVFKNQDLVLSRTSTSQGDRDSHGQIIYKTNSENSRVTKE